MHISNVGSQPIFHSDLTVQGYELLFRGSRTERTAGESMTSQVLLSALVDIGLDRLVGNATAYLNVPASMLLDHHLLAGSDAFPRDRFVLEIPEDTAADPSVLKALVKLAETGYTLALDDYVGQSGQHELLPYVQIVKVDILGMSPERIDEVIEPLRDSGLRMLAEKVETPEQLDACQELGFELFQGYLLSRPITRTHRAIPVSRSVCLRMLQTLANPSAGADELDRLVKSDPALSIRILRAASLGAANGLKRSLGSVSQAIILLGVRRLASLVLLTLMADDAATPTEQIKIAMQRARMCELLAQATGHDGNRGFTVGLLSAMDLLLAMPLPEVLATTELDEEAQRALLHFEGPHGRLLEVVLRHETGGQPDLDGIGVTERNFVRIYLDGLDYARQAYASLTAD